jgi:ribosome biogenesis GTPase
VVHPELIGFGPFFSSQLSLEELQSSLVGRAVADRGRGLLVRFPDGAHPVLVPGRLVDGPGIRELRLWDASGLAATFEDLATIAARCRFRDCSHEAEPGCAVREAVAEGRVDAARVESHRKLALELARQAERREGGAARAERERWKAVSKEQRRLSRERWR